MNTQIILRYKKQGICYIQPPKRSACDFEFIYPPHAQTNVYKPKPHSPTKARKKVQTSSLEPRDAALTQAGSQGAAMAL